jgi:hypothetical protein
VTKAFGWRMNRTGHLRSIPGISRRSWFLERRITSGLVRDSCTITRAPLMGLQSFTVAHSTSTGTRIEILCQHVRERIALGRALPMKSGTIREVPLALWPQHSEFGQALRMVKHFRNLLLFLIA